MRLIFVVFLFGLSACAATIPASYQSQSFIKIGSGAVSLGEFSYLPHKNGEVKSNQIKSSAIGTIYIATDISNFVRRATGLELERSGISIAEGSAMKVSAEIIEFKADDLGFSVDWTYSVHYTMTNTVSGETIIDKVYDAKPVKTGKFGLAADYSPSINELTLDALEQFMRDMRTSGLFK